MTAIVDTIDALNQNIARAIRWLALAMVLVTVTIVVLRYVFEIGAIPLQESVMYMHGILFLLGIPYGVNKNTHVRVDILYARLSAQRQTLVNLVGHLIFLLPIAVFILITSWPYTLASWRVLEGSSEVGGLPAENFNPGLEGGAQETEEWRADLDDIANREAQLKVKLGEFVSQSEQRAATIVKNWLQETENIRQVI